MANDEKVLKVVLNDRRKTKMKVKEVLDDGRYMLIDGSVVGDKEIHELIKE